MFRFLPREGASLDLPKATADQLTPSSTGLVTTPVLRCAGAALGFGLPTNSSSNGTWSTGFCAA